MLKLFTTNILVPVATRLGTMTTGALVGIGLNATHADWVGTGIAGALLIGSDLLASWLRKRWVVNTTFKQVIDGLFPEGRP